MSGAVLLRAAVFHTPRNPFRDEAALVAHRDGGLLVRDGRIVACGDFASVNAADAQAETIDWRGGCLLPGFVDAHVHFPQLRIIGSLGRSLLDWLEHVALPEEARMADENYASAIAAGFLHALASHGTTTALVFGAHFAGAMRVFFDAAARSGLRITSGLVLSDRRLRPELHQSAECAHRDSGELIRRYHGQGRLLYAVTPRFALSASEKILEVCQSLLVEHANLRVQTHLNENPQEIAEVARLFPWAADYLGVYERYGLAGRGTVMAHSVWSRSDELSRMAERGTAVAHCPCSNGALGSGVFPLRRHLDAGVRVALGTDVGGGTGFGVLKEALQAYLVQRTAPDGVTLDAARLLYLATRAGAEALALDDRIGDFTPGKSADFVYLRPPDGSVLADVLHRDGSDADRLAAIVTLAGAESIREVRVEGDIVFQGEDR